MGMYDACLQPRERERERARARERESCCDVARRGSHQRVLCSCSAVKGLIAENIRNGLFGQVCCIQPSA
jgi:hypothetical protein